MGIELEKGSKTKKGWDNIIDRMDKKIEGWKDKWLTKMGKGIKIKEVLSTLPTCPLSCLPLSESLNKKIEALIKSFKFGMTLKNRKNWLLQNGRNYVNQRN